MLAASLIRPIGSVKLVEEKNSESPTASIKTPVPRSALAAMHSYESLIQGEVTSPMSGTPPMVHVPMKCGYICVTCRMSHTSEKLLMTTACPCNGDDLHTTVLKRSVMCQNCNALSDDLGTFKKQVCYGRPASQAVSEPSTPRSAATASEPPRDPSPAQADAYMELRMAELEMGRLLLLESLEKERKTLEELVQQKQKATTGNTRR